MILKLQSLSEFAKSNGKEETAFMLGIGIATLYRWLKSGNYYIQQIEASESGDDAALNVWKDVKFLD